MIPAMIVVCLGVLFPQSFVKLEGPRLNRFYKTKGLSELGRPVLLRLPRQALNTLQRPWKGSAYRSFRHKGVIFLIHGRDPSLAQTLRKIRRNKKLDLRIRGTPRRMRRDGKTFLYVRIHSMKAVGLLRRRKKRTGPRFLELRNEGRTNVPEDVMSRVFSIRSRGAVRSNHWERRTGPPRSDTFFP